jgi:hypothetical protein
MATPASKSGEESLRFNYGRRLTLQIRGSLVPSDAGLLAGSEDVNGGPRRVQPTSCDNAWRKCKKAPEFGPSLEIVTEMSAH